MKVVLIRHGESKLNIKEWDAQTSGDWNIPLTERGYQQAVERGKSLEKELFTDSLVYCSPYKRSRQTLEGLLEGCGLSSSDISKYEDPRVREMEFGYKDVEKQLERRKTHGWFYYRFVGGESPADVYDRCTTFLESLVRQMNRKKKETAIIITHGVLVRCFVMRYLHLLVEDFNSMMNPDNCSVVTIQDKSSVKESERVFENSRWAVTGLRLYEKEED